MIPTVAADGSLKDVAAWAEGIAKAVPDALAQSAARAASPLEPIVAGLHAWAEAGALAEVDAPAMDILSRRLCPVAMAWMQVRPAVAAADPRRAVIDRWMRAQANGLLAIWTGPLRYRNNLSATAAQAVYAVGFALGDPQMRVAARTLQRQTLDTVRADGLTVEIRRQPPETRCKAEYYSWETLLAFVATARMAERAGDPSLWQYHVPGQEAAILLVTRQLELNLGDAWAGKSYARATGMAQTPYDQAPYTRTVVRFGPEPGDIAPPDWLAGWVGPVLERYPREPFPRLRAAFAAYRAAGCQFRNTILGGVMP